MKERQGNINLPKRLENIVELERPAVSLLVKLPYCRYEYNSGDRFYRHSMHTDMLNSFFKTLRDLKPRIRKDLLVEGRIISQSAWMELSNHPAYKFFFLNREHKRNLDKRKGIIKILMPKTARVTERQVKHYFGLDFKPDSLSKKIGFNVGWFPANYLIRRSYADVGYNSLLPYLGAVNQFRIGSNNLKPGLVRMVAVRMMVNFQDYAGLIAEYVQDSVSEDVIEASAEIFDSSIW